jgi:hypothetical protein
MEILQILMKRFRSLKKLKKFKRNHNPYKKVSKVILTQWFQNDNFY